VNMVITIIVKVVNENGGCLGLIVFGLVNFY
jgi:hypothetical protein